jgi:hypothetical protein
MRTMARARKLAAIVLSLFACTTVPVRAGHESSFYPSYYPQTIRIETVDATVAPRLLGGAAIHTFVGEDLFSGRTLPPNLRAIESLGSYLVLTFNPSSRRFHDRAARCATAAHLVSVLARDRSRYIFHPYPVLPYDADYLEHADLAEIATRKVQVGAVDDAVASRLSVKVNGQGALAEELVKEYWHPSGTNGDAKLATIDVADLLKEEWIGIEGGAGPPWLKEGWFHTYLLLAPYVSDPEAKAAIGRLYERLLKGDYHRSEERISLSRDLVTRLQQGCERVVIGYTVRRSYFNVDYNDGIENVGFDSQLGLSSAIFVRTAKLKAFPWNGELRIGIAEPPAGVWNPIGGFGDPFGRLVWAAVGDPAVLPRPAGTGWMPNRVTFRLVEDEGWRARLRRWLVRLRGEASKSIEVPADAVLPAPGSGVLQAVGEGKLASVKVEYRVLASSYHDGTTMTTIDALYPFILAYRWGDPHNRLYDPFIARTTAALRQHLIGIRPLRPETVTRNLGGDLQLKYDVFVIEAYLDPRGADPQAAVLEALPWSSLPWHLLVLIEAAAQNNRSASRAPFQGGARLREVDLVGSHEATERLVRLLEGFQRHEYVPESLAGWVTTLAAQHRWVALADFERRYGHLLVTNGPYRLVAWTPHAVKLDAFRNTSYPLGVGSFDQYVPPRRGYVTQVDIVGDVLKIHGEVERVIKFERTDRIVRERLGTNSSGAIDTINPQCRYLVISADGRVVKDGVAMYGRDGVYLADVGHGVGPGSYRVLVAIYLNENLVNPEIRSVPYTKH